MKVFNDQPYITYGHAEVTVKDKKMLWYRPLIFKNNPLFY
jgi:hypothetical protein